MKALLLAAAAVLALAGARGAGADLGYTDAGGDSSTGPDVASVQVANDATAVAWQVRFNNRPSLAADDRVLLGLNSDRNRQSGPGGMDYVVSVTAQGFGLGRWNGSAFETVTGDVAAVAFQNGVLQVAVQKSAFGITDALEFFVDAWQGADPATAPGDSAPDTGYWTYQLSEPVVVEAAEVTFAPKQPVAGKAFAATRVRVFMSDRTIVGVKKFTCKATLAGKALAGGCRWTLPATAKGKKLSVSVTIQDEGLAGAIKPYAFTVR